MSKEQEFFETFARMMDGSYGQDTAYLLIIATDKGCETFSNLTDEGKIDLATAFAEMASQSPSDRRTTLPFGGVTQ